MIRYLALFAFVIFTQVACVDKKRDSLSNVSVSNNKDTIVYFSGTKIYQDFGIGMTLNQYKYFEDLYIKNKRFRKNNYCIITSLGEDSVVFSTRFESDKLYSITLDFPKSYPNQNQQYYNYNSYLRHRENYNSTFPKILSAYKNKYGKYELSKKDTRKCYFDLGFENADGELIPPKDGTLQVGEENINVYLWKINTNVIEMTVTYEELYRFTKQTGHKLISNDITTISILYTSQLNYSSILTSRINELGRKTKEIDTNKITTEI